MDDQNLSQTQPEPVVTPSSAAPQIIRPTVIAPTLIAQPEQPTVSLPSPVAPQSPAQEQVLPPSPSPSPVPNPQPFQPQPQPVATTEPVAAVAPLVPPAPPVPSTPQPPSAAFAPEAELTAPEPQDVDNDNFSRVEQNNDGPDIYWQAPEFVDHQKDIKWFAIYAAVSVVVLVVGFVITRDVFSVVVLALLAVMCGIIAARKPQIVDFGLSEQGIFVGNRFYSYHDFNAFSINDEGKMVGIDFLPLKRFAPMFSIYCASEHEGEVKEFLANFLPLSQRKRSLIDGFTQRIHF